MKTIKLLSKQTSSQKKAKADLSYLEALGRKSKDGVYVPFWFWASEEPTPAPAPAPEPEKTIEVPTSDEQAVLDLLAQNPSINGSTLLNLIKSQGFVITKKQDPIVQEADTSSAQPAGVLVPKKESAPKQVINQEKKNKKSKMNLRESISCSFSESMKDNGIGPQKFKVVLLEEGLGNLRDAYFYTKEALKTAIPVFEGKKIYADHPSAVEEETRPERSVKDVLGHFENIRVEESEDGRSQLTGDVRILPDKPYEWARGLMRHAVDYSKKYPDKEFIGLSINASGDAEETLLQKFMLESKIPESVKLKLNKAFNEGIETIKLVHVISDATSCDLVTEAGAGGKVLEMLEGDKKMENLFESEEKKIEAEEKKLEGEEKKEQDTENKEAEEKKEEPKKEGEEALPQDDKKDGGEDHEDEEQDMKLIKSMLDKYLGKPEHDAEEMKMAKEAYQAARSMGEEESEAMKCAGYAMKMARHMASKSGGMSPEQPKEAFGKKDEEPKKEGDMENKESKKDEECKESDKIATLAAENAKLKETVRKIELEKHIESKLSESKLPRSATRLFKETVGDFRSKEDFDKKLEKFTTTYRETLGGEADELFSFVTMQEKAGEAPKSDSFADCVE